MHRGQKVTPHAFIILVSVVALLGCSGASPRDVLRGDTSTTTAAAPRVTKVLEYSFYKGEALNPETHQIEDFSEEDLVNAFRVIPWSREKWTSVELTLDGRSNIAVVRDPEDPETNGELVAMRAVVTPDSESFFYRSPPLTDADAGLQLLISFMRSDDKYKTAVDWTLTEHYPPP
jgi:hypothetical protein